MSGNDLVRASSVDGSRTPEPAHALGRKAWHVARTLQARLRFVVILVAVGGAIAYWENLKAYYEKWTRPTSAEDVAGTDTEFWCPMHPTVVRDHPDKCPICGMPLSKRKRGVAGEDEPLPAGVVSRVQLTPYRAALAGIQTEELTYRQLTKDIQAVGFVEFDERKLARITVRATGKSRIDNLYANVTGQTVGKGEPLARLYSPDLVVTVQNLLDARRSGNGALERSARERLVLWGIDAEQIDQIVRTGEPVTHLTIRSPISGHVIRKYQVEGEYVEEGARLYDVADLSTVWIEAQVYEDEIGFLAEGLAASAGTKAFPGQEFPGRVAFVHPHLDADTRTLRVRFDLDNPHHQLRPGMYAMVTLRVPAARLPVFADGAKGDEERAAELRQGRVLAVPERAVIDTGSRRFAYREAGPDIYEGVEVELGPRAGGYYPVVRGLRRGDRVATSGSFLIDAETRLVGGLGSTYFGASGSGTQADRRTGATVRPSMGRDEDATVKNNLAKLGSEDRRLAEEQANCPVLGNRLGAMGVPIKLVFQGQPVFLCCKGCVDQAKTDEAATLAKVAQLKARRKAGTDGVAPAVASAVGAEPAGAKQEAKVRANLAKLTAGDRELAEAQQFCAVQTRNRLGVMGVPVQVLVKGRTVFLCCEACKDDALANPDRTLAEVEKRKAERARPRRAAGE
jgi:multidrug efflux pump subunit AcrA (membrane-fusion protein)